MPQCVYSRYGRGDAAAVTDIGEVRAPPSCGACELLPHAPTPQTAMTVASAGMLHLLTVRTMRCLPLPGPGALTRPSSKGFRRADPTFRQALKSVVALGLLEEDLGHCVAGSVAEGGDTATDKVREATDAIARLVRS